LRSLVLAFLACSALAQSPADDFPSHYLNGRRLLKEKDYAAASAEFHRALQIRADAPPALLGLIEAYALSGDTAHRDSEIDHLRALIAAGKMPATTRFVREQFTAAEHTIVASEYPVVSLLRSRYLFEVSESQPFELLYRAPNFVLVSGGKTVRVYARGEPAYEEVVADVQAALKSEIQREIEEAHSADTYALAATPAVIVPIPITVNDPSDPRLKLKRAEVAIEYIAHSCFRIHSPKGTRILIDPYASRVWLGYDFPSSLAADAILITHPHYDHDADTLVGHQPPPWASDVRVLRDPGSYKLGDVTVTGIRGKHADPWGKEFGQTNTIWLLDVAGLRIAHLGDNGPLTEANLQALGRVDILMMPVDAKFHILKQPEIDAIRKALHPNVVVPMHYRIPDLESSPQSPEGLGEIGPWLAEHSNVVQLDSNIAKFSAASLPVAQTIMVFSHSPKVTRANASR